jgi:hypothetical protein
MGLSQDVLKSYNNILLALIFLNRTGVKNPFIHEFMNKFTISSI